MAVLGLVLHHGAAAQSVGPEGLGDRSAIWPRGIIEVCWEPSAMPYTDERGWVRESVVALIEHASTPRFPSSVTFVGWKDCATALHGVHIEVRDVRPITDVGRQWARDENKPDRPKLLDKRNMPILVPTRMVLNFTFKQEFRACAKQAQHCIRATAVHEFLHAIGFLHEQLRDDGGDCFKQFQHHPDFHGYMPVKIGGYDPDSHMNYCTRRMNGEVVSNLYRKPIRLSDGDKEVLSWFYPPQQR